VQTVRDVEQTSPERVDQRRAKVAELFLEKHRLYGNAGFAWEPDIAPPEPEPGALESFAVRLREARAELLKTRTFYRRISGPLLNKRERVAPQYRGVTPRESAVLSHLREHLPLRARSCEEAVSELRTGARWLAAPTGDHGSGLEELVLRAVEGSLRAFSADFGLSRGLRSIPSLVEAIRGEQWARLTSWELPEYFCCVVPAESTLSLFGGSWEAVADAAWAMSARMQYNSWHALPGNLPRDPAVLARDFFKPPTMPDVSSFSDQHHRGHVFNQVRFTIRCPQPVRVAGMRFDALVDLRLVRCEGRPFDEQEVCDAERIARVIAAATEGVAELVANGERTDVRSFDHVWHRMWVRQRLG
jgi:hypothetical protein